MRGAAVVVNHNSGADLRDCLAALLAQETAVRVVVVDCASSDLSRAVAEAPPAGVESLLLSENAGFAGGCNVGFEAVAAGADVIGFFNPDCFPTPKYFSACFEVLVRENRVAGVAGRLLRPGGVVLDSCGQILTPVLLRVDDRGYGRPAEGALLERVRVLAACGAAMVFRRTALDEVAVAGRVFPDEYFAFWEDLDLGWRLRNAGWEIAYQPDAVAVHRRGGTAGPGEGRMIFRRSGSLAAGILLNRWATLLRNCHLADLLPRLPLLLLVDMALAAAVTLRRPAALVALGRGTPRLRSALRQRAVLTQRRLGELL